MLKSCASAIAFFRSNPLLVMIGTDVSEIAYSAPRFDALYLMLSRETRLMRLALSSLCKYSALL